MVEYILFGVLGTAIGVGTTVLLSKRKSNDVFTIKSTGTKNSDRTTLADLAPDKLAKKKSKSEEPKPTEIENKIELIDMQGIKSIRLEGSADLTITPNGFELDENTTLIQKSETLIFKSDNSSIVGRITMSINGATFYDTNHRGVFLAEKVRKYIVPLKNYENYMIERVSLEGCGDFKVKEIKFGTYAEIYLKGSGDICLYGCGCDNLNLTLQGSGDINTDSITYAKRINANIKGSGDINIRVKNAREITNKDVKGRGDINILS